MKLYTETLGCPKNFNDSEGIAGIWEKAGMEMTTDPYEADAVLVNTCAFINDAKRESINKIFEMSDFIKETDGRKILIVTGCLSQRYLDDLFDEMPEVDIFLGVNDYEKLPEIVRNYREGQREKHKSEEPCVFNEFSARKLEDNPYTATLRIAEGCNNRCTYCVIPQIRGKYRSRPMENILAEAQEMADRGCREFILIAQDVSEYGRDLYGRLCLSELLRKLCRIEGVRWIRLMYCYEDRINDELIQTIAEEEKICSYIDIPLQHISDNVLKAMNRHSTSASIRNTIRKLREAVPDIHIRTTFITGFPGETEEDFEELLEFVETEKFERLGVFPYSREEGTPAAEMDGQIDEDIKVERADMIMRRQLDISNARNAAKVGSLQEVMVDYIDEDGSYVGRTQHDAPEIDNSVIFTSERRLEPGDMVMVRINDAYDYDIAGRMEEQ